MAHPESTQFAWLRNYAIANPLLVLWSLMLFFGGALLLSYHVTLGYLPDFNLVDLAGLMASVTVIGLLLALLFLFSCFVPGLALRWLEHQWPLIPYRRYLNFTELLMLWGSSVVVWAAYLLFAQDLLAYFPATWPAWTRPVAHLSGLAFASVIVAMAVSRRAMARFSMTQWRHRLISRHIVGFSLWIILFSFPVLAALKLVSSGDSIEYIALAIGAVVFLTFFNGVAYAASFSEIRDSLGIGGFTVVLMLLAALNVIAGFPQILMQTLALGHRNAVALTVTGKSCHSLARFGVGCTREDGKDGSIELENINVLSRVGTTVLIELLIEPADDSHDAQSRPSNRAGTLRLAQSRRRLYCPPPATGTAAACTACDSRLLQSAHLPGNTDQQTRNRYRDDLVCVQMTIAKSDIANIAFGAGRQYSGYSGFSLAGPGAGQPAN